MSCSRLPRHVFALLLCLLFIYTPPVLADQLSLPSPDLIAPEVIHTPGTESVNAGDAKTITANVTDNIAVQSVILFYRTIGVTQYDRLGMQRTPGSDDYAVEITGLEYPGIEYYIQATDMAGNTLLNGYSFSPLVVSVTAPLLDDGGSNIADGNTTADLSNTTPVPSIWRNKWVWIGLGVLATGAAIAASDSGGGNGPESTTIVVNAPVPGE